VRSSAIDSSGSTGSIHIINEDKNEVRRYLLGQLDEADEERLELRLLTDADFCEEFDTVVDEIADQYAGNEFQGEEQERVEQYFLRSGERKQKVHFARELLERAATERGGRRAPVSSKPSGFIERLLAFWRNQSFALRTAAAVAMIVIVVGAAFLVARRGTGPGTLTSISLTIVTADRASGTETKSVKLEPETRAVRVELNLPDQVQKAQNYRVELRDEQDRLRNLTVAERTDKSLFVEIPANELTRGNYIIQLYDDSGRRIRGGYHFNIL
jgi:hypothetical protein